MAIFKRFHRFYFFTAFFLCLAMLIPLSAAIEDDDEPLELGSVVKGAVKLEKPTVVPTQRTAPTPIPQPTVKPTPRPAPHRAKVRLDNLQISAGSQGLNLIIRGNKAVLGSAKTLVNPDRILLVLKNARLGAGLYSREINQGNAVRVRFSQKTKDVWMVVDLLGATRFLTDGGVRNGFGLTLLTGAVQAEKPIDPNRLAALPKSNLMFFDKNVMFNGVQYDRFPCANFIYDKADKFPLKREFDITMVFFDGFGAFVGNLRIVGPKGEKVAQTIQPFAFNLFNKLTDYSFTHTFDIQFKEKGFYKLYLTLNGEDVKVHKFYVGHNDDKVVP